MIEAKKLAYADMLEHVADPDSSVPVAPMLSKSNARERAGMIDMERGQLFAGSLGPAGHQPAPGADTIYLSVVDRDGNIVSFIQSNFSGSAQGWFRRAQDSCCIIAAGCSRWSATSRIRSRPEASAAHDHSRLYVQAARHREGSASASWADGISRRRTRSSFQTLSITASIFSRQWKQHDSRSCRSKGCDVAIERRIPDAVRRDLAARGHELEVQGDYCSLMGGGQAVMRRDGVNYGSSDPRKDGAAVPEPVTNNE